MPAPAKKRQTSTLPERRSSPDLIRLRIALLGRAEGARAEEPYRCELRLLAMECEALAGQPEAIFPHPIDSRLRIASESDGLGRIG
jgi:hypothetical protein